MESNHGADEGRHVDDEVHVVRLHQHGPHQLVHVQVRQQVEDVLHVVHDLHMPDGRMGTGTDRGGNLAPSHAKPSEAKPSQAKPRTQLLVRAPGHASGHAVAFRVFFAGASADGVPCCRSARKRTQGNILGTQPKRVSRINAWYGLGEHSIHEFV